MALFVVALCAGTSEASIITFSDSVTGVLAPDDPTNPFDSCVAFCVYDGTPGNEGVFTTQGYRFTALVNNGEGDEGLGIVVDASLVGVADNGTPWMLTGGIVQMTRTDAATFSLASFQAANVDPSDEKAGQFVRAFAFKDGMFFDGVHFDLNAAPGFQTFLLPATWTGLSAVNFSGRFLSSDGSPRIAAVDNIYVTVVPEPASLFLFGAGLVAVARRRLQARA